MLQWAEPLLLFVRLWVWGSGALSPRSPSGCCCRHCCVTMSIADIDSR